MALDAWSESAPWWDAVRRDPRTARIRRADAEMDAASSRVDLAGRIDALRGDVACVTAEIYDLEALLYRGATPERVCPGCGGPGVHPEDRYLGIIDGGIE